MLKYSVKGKKFKAHLLKMLLSEIYNFVFVGGGGGVIKGRILRVITFPTSING